MLGAIIGDVAGSSYEVLELNEKKFKKRNRSYSERIKILDEKVPLFNKDSSCTDDSILTCAIYDAIVNGNCEYEKYLRMYGRRELKEGLDMYGRSKFGPGFTEWLKGNYKGDSYGNGAAMRVSPVGFLFDNLDDVKENSFQSGYPSHNNVEALLAAEAVAVAVFLLRNGASKEEIQKTISANYYSLGYNMDDLQHNYQFTSRADNSVPQAFYVFLNSNSFEDAIRKAISIGGDTDTIACIVGSLAEAHYGVPEELKEEVKPYLKDYMYDLLKERYYNGKERKYERR